VEKEANASSRLMKIADRVFGETVAKAAFLFRG
jgi:hypothetical protein